MFRKYQLELRWAALDGTSSLDAEEEGDSSDAGEKTCVLESKNELEKLLGYCFTHSVSSSSPVAAETQMAASSSSFGFGHHRPQSTGEDHKPGGRGETLSRSPPATTKQGDVLRLGGAKEQHNSVIALHGATIVDSTMMSPEVVEVRGLRSDERSTAAVDQLPEELIHSSGGTKATLLQPDGSEKTLFGVERGLGNGTSENLLHSSQNTLLQVSPAVSATAKRAGTYGGALTGTALTDLDNYIDNARCGSGVSAKRASYYNGALTGTALTDLGTTRVRENCGGENAREEATAVLAQVAAEQLQSPSPQSPSPRLELADERKVPMSMIPTKSTTDGEDLAPDVENLTARGAELLGGSRAPPTQAPPEDPQRRVDLECRLGEEDVLPVLLDSDHRRNAIANWDPWDYSQSSTSGGPSQGPMDATSQTDEHRSNLSQKSQSNLSSQRGHYHASNVSSRLTVLNPQEASAASSKSSKETSYLSPSSSKERARRQRRESLQRMLELPGSSSARSSSKDREVEQEEASRGGVSPSRFQREAETEPGMARLEATRNANPAPAAPEAGSSSREVGLSAGARAGGMENRVLVVHSTSRAASTSAATSASLVSVEELGPKYLGRPHDLEHQGSSGTSSIVLLRGGPASTGNNSSSRNSTGGKNSGGQNSAWNSPETSDSIDLFLPVVSSGEDAEKRSTAGFRGGSLLHQYARVAGALLVRPGSVEKAADVGIFGGTTTDVVAGKRSGHLTATNAGGVKITPRNSATGNLEIRLEDHAVHKTSTDGTSNHNASAHPHPPREQEQERATSQDRNSSNAKSGASTQTLRGFQGLVQKLSNAPKNLSKENLTEKLFPGDSASNYCGAGSASQGSEVNNQEQKFAGQYGTSSSSGSDGSRSCSRDPLFELRRRWEAVEREERKARAAAATPNGETEANDQEPGCNHEATMKSKRTRGARRSESRGESWSSRGKTGAGGREMYQSRADRSLRLLQTAVQGGQRTKEKTEMRGEKTVLSLSEYRPGGARNLSPRSRFFGSSGERSSAAKSNEKAQVNAIQVADRSTRERAW